MLGIVINSLQRCDRTSGFTATVGIAIIFWKIRRGDIQSQTVADFETVCCCPQVDLKSVNAPWLQRPRLTVNVTISGAKHAHLELDRASIRKHIAEARRKIRITRA